MSQMLFFLEQNVIQPYFCSFLAINKKSLKVGKIKLYDEETEFTGKKCFHISKRHIYQNEKWEGGKYAGCFRIPICLFYNPDLLVLWGISGRWIMAFWMKSVNRTVEHSWENVKHCIARWHFKLKKDSRFRVKVELKSQLPFSFSHFENFVIFSFFIFSSVY